MGISGGNSPVGGDSGFPFALSARAALMMAFLRDDFAFSSLRRDGSALISRSKWIARPITPVLATKASFASVRGIEGEIICYFFYLFRQFVSGCTAVFFACVVPSKGVPRLQGCLAWEAVGR